MCTSIVALTLAGALVSGCYVSESAMDIAPVAVAPPSPPPPLPNSAPSLSVENMMTVGQSIVSATITANDADNDPLTITWSRVSGPEVTLIERNETLKFLAPDVAVTTDLVLEVSVTDGTDTVTDQLTVSLIPSVDTLPDLTGAIIQIAGATTPEDTNSYDATKTVSIINRGSAINGVFIGDAHAFVDLDGDADEDLVTFAGLSTFEGDKFPARAFLFDPVTFAYSESMTVWENAPPMLEHARKTLVADLNGDGVPDFFFIGHGHDAPPFAGEPLRYSLSGPNGYSSDAIADSQFWHGGGAEDIDGDGDLDVVLVTGGAQAEILINDGTGGFSFATPINLGNPGYFTLDLLDVDRDGCADILTGGHEFEGALTKLFLGNCQGEFLETATFPETAEIGIVIDFEVEDLDNDGAPELVLTRVGDPSGRGFYVGSAVEFISLEDGLVPVSLAVVEMDTADWTPWLRAQDLDNDGDVDVFSDDIGFGFTWQNNFEDNQP